MEFRVCFEVDKSQINSDVDASDIAVMRKDLCNVGLIIIDDIRETFNAPNLDINKIKNNTSCQKQYCVECRISEQNARTSGHFKDTTYVKVCVPNLFLTSYQAIRYLDKNEFETLSIFGFEFPKFWKKKEITEIAIYTKILGEDIIADWLASGSPTKWDETNYKTALPEKNNANSNR